MRNGQEEEEEEEEEEANPTTSSAVIFSRRRCKAATTAATRSECVLPKWSMYSGKKPVEWLDLSRQLFLARHAACVAVKSAFLRDHLNAAAAGCQVCNRPIRQSAYYQLPITSSVYCQLAPLLAACCHLPLATCHCASVVAALSGALICRRKFVSSQRSAGQPAIRLARCSYTLLASMVTESFQLQHPLLLLSFFADC